MLDLGILLSSSIEETVIAGKKVFSVADGYLLACFYQRLMSTSRRYVKQSLKGWPAKIFTTLSTASVW